MEIAGTLEIEPTSNEDDVSTRQFQEMPVLRGATPSGSDSPFVVALEPIGEDKIGRVAISGVVQVKLDVESESDTTALTKDDSTSELVTGLGNAQILWKESGTGPNKWALMRFGGKGSGEKARLCKTTTTWVKNTATTLEVWESGSANSETSSFGTITTAVNKIGTVGSGKFVIISPVQNGRYYLVAAEC
jgi:hypothetical protein